MIDVKGDPGISIWQATYARNRAYSCAKIGYGVAGSEGAGASQLGIETYRRAGAE